MDYKQRFGELDKRIAERRAALDSLERQMTSGGTATHDAGENAAGATGPGGVSSAPAVRSPNRRRPGALSRVVSANRSVWRAFAGRGRANVREVLIAVTQFAVVILMLCMVYYLLNFIRKMVAEDKSFDMIVYMAIQQISAPLVAVAVALAANVAACLKAPRDDADA